jgi:hypothetical protein
MSITPPGAEVVSTPENTATGLSETTVEPLRSAMVLVSSWKVASSVSRLSTSKGPRVTTIGWPGLAAAIGGLPLMRQRGSTVTVVSGSVPTMVIAARSMMSRILIGCPAGQPTTR